MNQPNPFGAGGFKLNGTLHSAQPNTPPQSPKPPKRPGPTKSSPVIPPPDSENNSNSSEDRPQIDPFLNNPPVGTIVITDRPPLRSRIARIVAWMNLTLATVYASSLVFRLLDFIADVRNPANFPLILISLRIIAPIGYVVLHNVIAGCIEGVNDIFLGIVDAWPEPLTLPQFFERLKVEAALNLARTALHSIDLPEIAAVIPQRPHLNSTARSLFYMATYLTCFFCVPAAGIIKAVFWKIEGLFAILFLAYILTNFRAYREQYRP